MQRVVSAWLAGESSPRRHAITLALNQHRRSHTRCSAGTSKRQCTYTNVPRSKYVCKRAGWINVPPTLNTIPLIKQNYNAKEGGGELRSWPEKLSTQARECSNSVGQTRL